MRWSVRLIRVVMTRGLPLLRWMVKLWRFFRQGVFAGSPQGFATAEFSYLARRGGSGWVTSSGVGPLVPPAGLCLV